MLRGNPMWNGWKKAAIGLSALLAFVVLELVAVIGGVAVFLALSWTWICRSSRSPRNSRPGVPLTQQPVDEAGRCAGQAERQRHAHQHFVAIDWGWWGAQRIDPRARSFQFMRQENVSRAPCSLSLGNSGRFGAVLVPLTPKRQCRPSSAIIKIVMIQWLFKISLS